MNVSAINSSSSASSIASLHAWHAEQSETGAKTQKTADTGRDPAAIKKVASQFEAIILRQLLAPSIEPMMNGSLGGAKGSGGSMYGYMLTDALSTNIAQGGGMGLARILERNFNPRAAVSDVTDTPKPAADSHL